MLNQTKAEKWALLIDELDASGLSVAKFAEARELKLGTLNYWRKKFGRLRSSGRSPSFMEVIVGEGPASGSVILSLTSSGARVVVDEHTDLVLLRRLVASLC